MSKKKAEQPLTGPLYFHERQKGHMKIEIYRSTWALRGEYAAGGHTVSVCEGPLPYDKDVGFDALLYEASRSTPEQAKELLKDWM